jgi:TonB family protein
MLVAVFMAAAVVAAEPATSTGGWVTPDEYPRAALQEGRSGVVQYRLSISPQGKPIACAIERSSGHVDLDEVTCRLLMRRSSFEPARDASGAPAFGAFRSASIWWTGDGDAPSVPLLREVEATTANLPLDIEPPVIATTAMLIGPDGAVSNCVPIPAQPSAPRNSPRGKEQRQIITLLGKEACDKATANWRPAPVVDAAGTPVPSVQTARILFRAQP